MNPLHYLGLGSRVTQQAVVSNGKLRAEVRRIRCWNWAYVISMWLILGWYYYLYWNVGDAMERHFNAGLMSGLVCGAEAEKRGIPLHLAVEVCLEILEEEKEEV